MVMPLSVWIIVSLIVIALVPALLWLARKIREMAIDLFFESYVTRWTGILVFFLFGLVLVGCVFVQTVASQF